MYEHKLQIFFALDIEDERKIISEQEKEGWELVCVRTIGVSHNSFYWKRSLPQSPSVDVKPLIDADEIKKVKYLLDRKIMALRLEVHESIATDIQLTIDTLFNLITK